MNIVKRIISLFSKEEDTLSKALLCAKDIINNGEIVEDNTSSRSIPSVKFKDDKGNTLYISWYHSIKDVVDVMINGDIVPKNHDAEIFRMAQNRIQVLRKEHLERVVAGVK